MAGNKDKVEDTDVINETDPEFDTQAVIDEAIRKATRDKDGNPKPLTSEPAP